MTDEPTLTVAAVAAKLGVHTDDVRRWIRNEECPVVKVGRKVRVPAAWADDPKGWLRNV